MFSEELRILISNIQISQYQQKIDLKVYNSSSQELSHLELQGERVLLLTANSNFFSLYTNKQQLHVFSSNTTELIQRGLVIEGVCMMAQNQENNLLGLLNLKGNVLVYKVVSPDYPSINSVVLQHEASLQSILKYESAES